MFSLGVPSYEGELGTQKHIHSMNESYSGARNSLPTVNGTYVPVVHSEGSSCGFKYITNKMLVKKIHKIKDDDDEDKVKEIPSCIICIGSTGSGKSSTISKYTQLPIASNAGANRVTKKCTMYRRPQAKYAWVDTVGLDDSNFDDQETFKDILRFIDENYMTSVKAIIWNVNPNVRCDALLTTQAKLINLFAPQEIWNNVIIIVKQSLNPDDDGRGAISAALEFDCRSNVQLLGYRYIDDETFNDKQRSKMQEDSNSREVYNVYKDIEVKEAIENALENIEQPIQVVFRSSKCLDCNQRGDDRLFSKYCHMQSIFIHTGISEDCHPGHLEPYHSESIKYHHQGRLLNTGPFGGKRYLCCYRKVNTNGCIARWKCCGGLPNGIGCRTRYSCCQKDIAIADRDHEEGCQKRFACCRGRMEDPGCTEVCKKCDKLWGTPTENCFVKMHNLLECDADNEDLFTNISNDPNANNIDEKNDVEDEDNAIIQRDNKIPGVILIHVF